MMERIILIVDDEVEIGAALARMLRRYSYKILRAKSGNEGLALLAEHDVGVVLSDQRMPEMTGIEFLSQVKELYPQTIRIILSGYTDLEVVMDAINRGAIYKFFTKPWDSEILCAELLEAFRHRELNLEKEGLIKKIQLANDMLAQVNTEMIAAVAKRDIQIEHISHYSRQTNLPNRQLFIERVEQDLTRSQQNDHIVAIMFINLDRFKQVNDSFGHLLGDVVLQVVAGRLKKHARAGDTVAHLGGDEFGFLLSNMISVKAAADVAQRLIDSFVHEPISVGDSEIFVSSCLGISLYPFDGVDANTLLKNSNAALHHAKKELPDLRMYDGSLLSG
ncbi:MAG: diguanylate cyclase [Candidatus Nitrotoga sp.]